MPPRSYQGPHRTAPTRPPASSFSHPPLPPPSLTQVNGAVASGPDLSVVVNGLRLPNPFVIGSGPPGTNYAVMKKAFEEGWGAVIAKTVSIDSSKVVNVTPRCGLCGVAVWVPWGWEPVFS